MELANPEAMGFDPARLARIEQFLQGRYIDSGRLKGLQFLLAREGRPVQFVSQGVGGEDGRPVASDALFRIASMTKPVTSLAFMMLVEEGLVALDDPVHRVLPEFKGLGVYAGGGGGIPFVTRPTEQPMRMIDLLRHTSGLTYSFQNRSNVDAAYREGKIEQWRGNLDLDGLVATLGTLPLEFSPGTAWNYSLATDVLGAVVQRLAGKSLDVVFAERIFAPLGMTDTFFQVPEDKLDRLGDAYAFAPGNPLRHVDGAAAKSHWASPPTQLSGGGGLVSSTADYHRFCCMLLNRGELEGTRLASRKTIDLMTANHLPGNGDLAGWSRSLFSEAALAGTGFGLGFAVNLNVAAGMVPGSVGEFYWGGMYSTAFFVDPVERIHMVFMTQLMPSSTYPIRRELKTLIYSALAD